MSLSTATTKRLRFAGNIPRYYRLFRKYQTYTMIRRNAYMSNLAAAELARNIEGCVVECGVWRGGMIAGIAETLGPQRNYYLFDSYEGLPEPTDRDGDGAKAWRQNTNGPNYHDNCRAEKEFAEKAMQLSGVKSYQCMKGWFDQTLATFTPAAPIALLRIDADWYDSVLCCLTQLHRHLAKDAVVIFDDYYTWDGCAKAVHRFLADMEVAARIRTEFGGVCVLTGLT